MAKDIAQVTVEWVNAQMDVEFQLKQDYLLLKESVTVGDFVSVIQSRPLGDVVTMHDMIVLNDQPFKQELMTVSEVIAKSITKVLHDSFTLTEQIGVTGRQLDFMTSTDSIVFATVKKLADTLAMSDSVTKLAVKSSADAVTVAAAGTIDQQNYVTNYYTYFAENYVIASRTVI